MPDQPKPEPIIFDDVPEKLFSAALEVGRPSSPEECRRVQKQGSRQVIRALAARHLGDGSLELSSCPSGRPLASYNGRHIQVSMAHSGRHCIGALSEHYRIGIDLEPMERTTHPGLAERMSHSDESDRIRHLPPVRIWTLKEAVLKWHGTGLRIAMSNVLLEPARQNLYRASVERQKVHCYSGAWGEYWVALAWSPADPDRGSS